MTLFTRLLLSCFLGGPCAPNEDTSGGFTRGGWFVPFIDERFIQIIKDWVGQADAFLFGRRTYQNFARDWPKMDNAEDPVATALNHLPKYVATRNSVDASWNLTDGPVAAGRGEDRSIEA